jgi:hypothetical protein
MVALLRLNLPQGPTSISISLQETPASSAPAVETVGEVVLRDKTYRKKERRLVWKLDLTLLFPLWLLNLLNQAGTSFPRRK